MGERTADPAVERDWLADTRASYDRSAVDYAEIVSDILDGRQPHLGAALRLFAAQHLAHGGGLVADIGCGPGHVTAHLNELGVDCFGLDLSPKMIDIARANHPELKFEVGSMTNLDLADGSLSALVAWWSLIHIPDDLMPVVLGEFSRVLRPGGSIQVGFHVGDQISAETSGVSATAYGLRRQSEQVANWLTSAGFPIEAQWAINMDTGRPGALIFARRS